MVGLLVKNLVSQSSPLSNFMHSYPSVMLLGEKAKPEGSQVFSKEDHINLWKLEKIV